MRIVGDGSLVKTTEGWAGWLRTRRSSEIRTSLDAVACPEWDMITELAAAVHRGDASRAQCEAVRFGQQGINGKRYYLYLDVLVGSAIRSRLGTQPTLENIDQLAAEIYPAWAKIVRFDRRTLRDLLLTSCDLLEGEEQVMDYRVSGSAAAALGVLLRKPRRDLRRMSPMLGSFLAEHEAELRPFGFHD